MFNRLVGFIIVCMLGLIAVSIGAAMATYFFLGLVTFAGFVALCESINVLKYIVAKCSRLVDAALFILTIVATISFGVTVAACLTIAGLMFSLIYAPYLRSTYRGIVELVSYRGVPYSFIIKERPAGF